MPLFGEPPSKEPGRYYDFGNRFSIKFPNGWEIKKEREKVIAISPQEGPNDMFREWISVASRRLSLGRDFEDFWQKLRSQSQTAVEGYREHSVGEATIDHEKAKRIVWSHTTGRRELKVLLYALGRGSRAYIIACTAEPSEFDRYGATFEETAASFRVQ